MSVGSPEFEEGKGRERGTSVSRSKPGGGKAVPARGTKKASARSPKKTSDAAVTVARRARKESAAKASAAGESLGAPEAEDGVVEDSGAGRDGGVGSAYGDGGASGGVGRGGAENGDEGEATSDAAAARQVRAGAERAAAERNQRRLSPLLVVPEEPLPAVPDADIPRPSVVPPSSAASMVFSIAGQIGQSLLTALTEPPAKSETGTSPTSSISDRTATRPRVVPESPPDREAAEDPDRLLQAIEFLRSRLAGDYEIDAFGFDPEFADAIPLNLLRPLYQHWFRVEVRGAENIPADGGALIVANHSGTLPLDALMTAVAVREERERHLRILGGDLVFQTPFLAGLARRSGATLAANPDAERLLSSGELVGVWPEGYKGIGKPFSERYKLQRFGRGGFVSAALRTGAPIVPCSIVGAEEIYPIIASVPSLARLLGLPYLPVTPFFPLLGPLGAIPLPSKWLIEFGPPIRTDDLGVSAAAAADDPILVFDLTDRVRQTIQQTLYSLLVQRRSVFF